jgi:PAS domain S-box-containing protein
VILDDSSAGNPFFADGYIRQDRARSVLVLPLLKQTKLIGVLYLENNLTPHVFTPARIAVLKLLASEAATSLENTRLYGELKGREARIRRLVEANIIGILIGNQEGRIIETNEAFLRIVKYNREEFLSRGLSWMELTPPEWREADEQALAELSATGICEPFEKEYFRKDGTRVPVFVGAALLGGRRGEGVAFVLDLTERKRAEENLRESERRRHEAQMELAHTNRVTTMGQLAASIAHEVKQPITAIVTNGDTGLRWLARQPPNVEGAQEALGRVINAAHRANDVIDRIRALVKKAPPRKARLDINGIVLEVVALTRDEANRNRVALRPQLLSDLPPISADRIQLQQVVLNLIINAIEAMSGVSEGARQLWINTGRDAAFGVLVEVRDSGPGLDPQSLSRLFSAFHTTKPGGMGMGLSICRSIIEEHGGRLWATANVPQGAIFQFTLPAHPDGAS